MSKTTKVLISAACAVLLTAGTITGNAKADYAYVQGALDTTGALVQYDYTRTHSYYGPITLDVNHMPYGYLRLGLRNMGAPGGPQFTETHQWNRAGVKSWNDILAGTRFAFQGRMKRCDWGCPDYWGGHLNY